MINLTLECKFFVPMIARYTERLQRSKDYRNVLDSVVLRSKSQRCNYELHFLLDGAPLNFGLPVHLRFNKFLNRWVGCGGPKEIGPDRTLCGSLCWVWPNKKHIDSNHELLMNSKYISPLLLNSEVKVLGLGLPGFRNERNVLIPVLESDTKS